ncbi:MAG: glycosyltransferase family 4 protein [Syntrophobacterales bacterium]|jgi:glycosyltransferase involved in cell wall biosynthesis
MHVVQIAPPWVPIPPQDYGGTELMVANLVRGLVAQGVDILLFASGDSTLEVPCLGPFSHAFWPPDKFSENLHLFYAFRHLKEVSCQVIHSHLENAAGFWALAEIGVPLIITLHTPLTPIKVDYLKGFPEAQVVTVSEFQYRQLNGHPSRHLIPHGLEIPAYPFQADKEDFLLFLGRIYPDKGLHTAIRAARDTGRRLVIAGPVFAPDQPYFDALILPELNGEFIVNVGPVDFHRKVDLLKRARVLISPLEVDEAFGLVMLEAMACGTPVVAYHRGAVPEVVRHGETGFVVHSYQELKKCLNRVSDIEPERCREHVQQNFSREAMVSAYLALYHSQVDKQTPRVAG